MTAARPPFGVNLSGHLTGEFGLGHAARAVARALAAAGVPVALNDFVVPLHRAADRTLTRFTRDNPFAVNLCCMNPDAVAAFARQVGPGYWRPAAARRYNIAFWNWETPTPPAGWRDVASLFDEFWAPSRYTAESLRGLAPGPVTVVPYPVDPPPVDPGRFPGPSAAGLRDGRFNVLYVFDFASTAARKNPAALVRAFNRAFPPSRPDADFPRPPALTLKAKNSALNVRAKLDLLEDLRPQRAHPGRAALVDEDWDHAQVLAAIRYCDAYASPHRSEGFGLTVAEAMAFARPVVMSNYSAAGELAPESCYFPVPYAVRPVGRAEGPYPADTVGADVDTDALADRLREVIADPAAAAAVGRRAERYVRDRLRPAAIGRRIWDELATHIYPSLG